MASFGAYISPCPYTFSQRLITTFSFKGIVVPPKLADTPVKLAGNVAKMLALPMNTTLGVAVPAVVNFQTTKLNGRLLINDKAKAAVELKFLTHRSKKNMLFLMFTLGLTIGTAMFLSDLRSLLPENPQVWPIVLLSGTALSTVGLGKYLVEDIDSGGFKQAYNTFTWLLDSTKETYSRF